LGEKMVNFNWSTNKKVVAHIDQPKWALLGDYILAIKGCYALKFLNALQIDQGYLAHTPAGTGVAQKILMAKI